MGRTVDHPVARKGERQRTPWIHPWGVVSDEEKQKAFQELEDVLHQVEIGEIPDFRMVIRGATRATHGNSTKLSGRAKELAEKGFYFLKYSGKGAKMSDVWDILPEDTQGRKYHYAPYPEDLVKNPVALTCPYGGIVLDPFVGLEPPARWPEIWDANPLVLISRRST